MAFIHKLYECWSAVVAKHHHFGRMLKYKALPYPLYGALMQGLKYFVGVNAPTALLINAYC